MTQSIQDIQRQHEASFMPFGPAELGVQLVESFGEYEAEYGAIRKGAAILHTPQRGLVEVTGADRLDFLHRFVSNDTQSLQPGQGRRAFLLNNKGRIDADLVMLETGDKTLLVLDRFGLDQLVTRLDQFLFTEDVKLADRTPTTDQLAVHGPQAKVLIDALADESIQVSDPLRHVTVKLAGVEAVVYRRDETGAPGWHVIASIDDLVVIYQAMVKKIGGLNPEVQGGVKREFTARGLGWLAFNTARIEAGTAIYHIDFGPDSLPHETGAETLAQAVSFNKGCYLGQEIVARMQSLGHPKKILVGLRCDDARMPVAGSEVFTPGEQTPGSQTSGKQTPGELIGAVTSSTVSPMLGGKAIALAMVRWASRKPDTPVRLPAEGAMVDATVQGLGFI